jgi:hypothetical protein
MIEVSGDKGEKLTVLLDFKTGECRAIELKGEKIECNDIRYTSRLEENYFCIPAKFAEDNKKNSVINDADGEKDMYCGKVTFLTNGADIQIKSSLDPEAGNRKCKNVGGHVICYPPL